MRNYINIIGKLTSKSGHKSNVILCMFMRMHVMNWRMCLCMMHFGLSPLLWCVWWTCEIAGIMRIEVSVTFRLSNPLIFRYIHGSGHDALVAWECVKKKETYVLIRSWLLIQGPHILRCNVGKLMILLKFQNRSKRCFQKAFCHADVLMYYSQIIDVL